ncbi:MAG TPA: DeoR/GlpR family DNA-binding transcription regulator [Anaerolineaceae bacterium]
MTTEPKMDEPVFAEERQARIAALVAQHGKMRTAQLIGLFGVSEPTLRKDLSILEQHGLLKRTHGGAVSVSPPLERELKNRSAQNQAAKHAIALACLREICDGDGLFLDSGTTVLEIARLLPQSGYRISVLTNSPDVAEMIADCPHITHVLLGGHFRRFSRATSGPVAIDFLSRFTLTAAFIGVSGLTEHGLTVADVSEAQLKENVIARAKRVIVPADHTKFGVSDFVRVCSLDEIDAVVTEVADEHIQNMCDLHSVRLVIAEGN